MGCREATWILDDVNNWWQMLCMNSLNHLEMLGSWRLFGKIVFVEIFGTREIQFFYQISMKFVGFWLWKIKKATCWVYISRFLCVSKLMSISERSKSGAFSMVSQQKPEDLPEKSTLSRSKRGCWDRGWPYLFWIWECFKKLRCFQQEGTTAYTNTHIHIYI